MVHNKADMYKLVLLSFLYSAVIITLCIIILQFWNIPVTVVPYSGEQALPEHFVVTVSPPNKPARRFIAVRFSHNWDNSPGPCMYVGNSQGAPSGEVTDPNDSVIEPNYRSYRVDSLHNTRFTFNQFREGVCPGP